MNLNMNVDKLVTRLFFWCLLSAISSIPIVILFSIGIYFVYGCWPLNRNLFDNCLGTQAPVWIIFIPMIFGGIIGFIWSGKIKIKLPEL